MLCWFAVELFLYGWLVVVCVLLCLYGGCLTRCLAGFGVGCYYPGFGFRLALVTC